MFDWRAIFLVNIPLGIVTLLLAYRYLPVDRRMPKSDRAGFDSLGTLLLALTLAAYALAMTIGRGSFGSLNVALLLASVFGAGLFVVAERRAASPLVIAGDVDRPAGSFASANARIASGLSIAARNEDSLTRSLRKSSMGARLRPPNRADAHAQLAQVKPLQVDESPTSGPTGAKQASRAEQASRSMRPSFGLPQKVWAVLLKRFEVQ